MQGKLWPNVLNNLEVFDFNFTTCVATYTSFFTQKIFSLYSETTENVHDIAQIGQLELQRYTSTKYKLNF